MNHVGTLAVSAFIGVLFTGYVLIFRPPVQVTVSSEAAYAFGGVLSAVVLDIFRLRRHQR